MAQESASFFSLDRVQRAAAESTAGALAITGGPGVGKTRTLVARVRHWLDAEVLPEDILVVTPTGAQVEVFLQLLDANGGVPTTITVSTPRRLALEFLRFGYSLEFAIPSMFTVWGRTRTLRALELFGERLIGRPIDGYEAINFLLMTESSDSGKQWPGAKADWAGLLGAFTDLKKGQHIIEARHLASMARVCLQLQTGEYQGPESPPWGHLAIDNLEDLTRDEVLLLFAVADRQPKVAVAVNVNEQVRGVWGPENDEWEEFLTWVEGDMEVRELRGNYRLPPPLVHLEKQVRVNCGLGFHLGTDSTSLRPRGRPARLHHVRGTREQMDRLVLGQMQELAEDNAAWEDMACLSYRPHTRERFRRLLVQEQVPYTVLGDLGDTTGDALLDKVVPLVELVANPRDMGALQAWHDSLYQEMGVKAGLPVTRRICRWLASGEGGLAEGISREAARHRDGTPVREVLELSVAAYGEVSAIARQGNQSVEAVWRKAFDLMGPVSGTGISDYLDTISAHLYETAGDAVCLLQSVETMCQGSRWRWTDRKGISLATFQDSKGLQWNNVWLLDVGAADITVDASEDLQRLTSASVARPLYVGLTRSRLDLFLYYAYTPVEDRASWPFIRRSTPAFDEQPLRYVPQGEFLNEVWLDSEGRVEYPPGKG